VRRRLPNAALAAETGCHLPLNVTTMEQRFILSRSAPPALGRAFRSAIHCVAAGHRPSHVSQALDAGGAIVEAVERMAVADGDHPYHNRHHIVEAVSSMGWLCSVALKQGLLTRQQALLGVLAMAGHDLGHDGSRCMDGRLEIWSASLVRRIVEEAGLGHSAGQLVGVIILATMPGGLEAARRSGYDCPASTETEQTLCQLAREADLAASLLPALGRRLSFALRREWRRANDASAERVISYASRQAFLADHRPHSAAACRLGLTAVTAMQAQAFAAAARHLGVGMGAATGARALDQMTAIRARRLYGKIISEGALPVEDVSTDHHRHSLDLM